MRLTLFLLIAFSVSGYSQELDSLTVKNAAFIGVVKINEIEDWGSGNSMLYATPVHCFKVTKILENQVVFQVKGDPSSLAEGYEYLVFAQDGPDRRYSLNKDSRILWQGDSEKDVAYLLSVLPCFDSKIKELRGYGCFYRDGLPVCGCDSQTYTSPCEALRNGIVIFKQGVCK
jgi:hypothetical protein